MNIIPASGLAAPTLTATFCVLAPQAVATWSMRHWKLYVPADEEATTLTERTTLEPGHTSPRSSSREAPQVVLSPGLTEPSWNWAPGDQVLGPVFCSVTLTL